MAAIAQAAPGARSEPPFPDNRSWEVDRVVLAQASERRAWLLEPRDLVHLILDLRRRRPRAGIPGRFGLIRTEMTMRWNSIALAAASALLALLADTRAAAGDPAATAGEGLTFSSASVPIERIQVKSRGFIRRCGRIDAPARQPAEPEVHQRQPARQGDRGAQRQALAPIEIFSFCDALAAQKMIEPDVSMLAYMPCRIGIPEDGQGGTWIVAMLIEEAVIQALPAAARESAQYVTGTMQEIVVATARRDL